MKKTNKSHVILRGETYNEIVRRLEALEKRHYPNPRRAPEAQAYVTNATSTPWPAFSVVSLDSPSPATGIFFNESKSVTGDITPDLHVYDPEGRYGITQQGALPSNGTYFDSVPVIVSGYTTVRLKTGGDPAHKFVRPSDESGKMETTTDATPFRLVGIEQSTDHGKILIQGGGGGGGGSQPSVNIAIARCQQNVIHTDDTFSASLSVAITGTVDAGSLITVKNLRVGFLESGAVGNVSPLYPGASSENIFVLTKGQFIIVIQDNGGGWQILQSGAVYNTAPIGGPDVPVDPSDPSDPGDPSDPSDPSDPGSPGGL